MYEDDARYRVKREFPQDYQTDDRSRHYNEDREYGNIEERRRFNPLYDDDDQTVDDFKTEHDRRYGENSKRLSNERRDIDYKGRRNEIDGDSGRDVVRYDARQLRGYADDGKEEYERDDTKMGNTENDDARLRRWNELLEKSNQLEREEKELKLQLQILQAEQRIKSLKREQEQLIHEG